MKGCLLDPVCEVRDEKKSALNAVQAEMNMFSMRIFSRKNTEG